MLTVVICPDSFKGCLAARAAAEAVARGVRRARPEAQIHVVPMADGGEGTLDVLLEALHGSRRRVAARDPLMRPVETTVGLIRRAATAIVELAGVAGYALLAPEERDPIKTTTYGLGAVLRAAIESGVDEIILAVGGSATLDGGAGMMQALGLSLIDRAGRVMTPGAGGGSLAEISYFVWDRPPEGLDSVQVTIAADVLNPACGPSGAAAVFGPQKGADPAAVRLLDAGLAHWADLLEAASGRLLRAEPGTGAAGGVALPLIGLCNAVLMPGVDLVSEAVGLSSLIGRADLVITGEGRIDRQSMMGKVVGAVGRMCRAAEVPCVAIAGVRGEGADECLSVLDRIATLDAPLDQTAERLTAVAEALAIEIV